MRVLVDGYNLGLKHGTGIATYARNLIHTLGFLGHEVSVLYDRPTAWPDNPLLNEIYFFDPKEAFSTELEKALHVLLQLTRAPRALISEIVPLHPARIPIGSEVVTRDFSEQLPECEHICSYRYVFNLAFIYFFLTGRFLRVRVDGIDIAHWTFPVPLEAVGARNIYTIHDLVPIRLPHTTLDNKSYFDKLLRTIIRKADRLVTVSEFSRRDILKTYPAAEAKLTVTRQCVRMPESLLALTEEDLADFLMNRFRLQFRGYYLAVGATEPKKNLGRLIDAFLATGIDAPLVVLGPKGWRTGGGKTSFDHDLDWRLSDPRVIRLPYQGFSSLVRLVRGAKVLCFPSLYEGFGLPVLEAMTLGTPVLTSNTASLPEVAGDAAVYVDPYDVEDLKSKLLWCKENPQQLEVLARRGQQQASRYSAEGYAQALEPLYV